MARALYIVTIEVTPEVEREWSEWHSRDHIPGVLAQPGFCSARKYRNVIPAAHGWARYTVHYELESIADFERYTESEAAHRLRQDHDVRYGAVTRLTRQVLYELETFTPPPQAS